MVTVDHSHFSLFWKKKGKPELLYTHFFFHIFKGSVHLKKILQVNVFKYKNMLFELKIYQITTGKHINSHKLLLSIFVKKSLQMYIIQRHYFK